MGPATKSTIHWPIYLRAAQLLLRDERDPERRRSLATINSQAFRRMR